MVRALASVVVLSSSLALADLTLINEVTSQGKTRTVTLSVKGTRACFEVVEPGTPARSMLRDSTQKKMWLLDATRKTAVVVTEEDSKALEARQAQFRAQMKAQLEKMPPEARKRAEATMLAMAEAPKASSFSFEKKKGAPARKVAGFSCEDWLIKRDGQLTGEGCFAAWKVVGLNAADFQKQMADAMPAQASNNVTNGFEMVANAPGMLLERTMVDAAGAVTSKTVVKSLSKTALEASKFEVPKDYTERSMKDAMPGTRAPAEAAPEAKPAPTKTP